MAVATEPIASHGVEGDQQNVEAGRIAGADESRELDAAWPALPERDCCSPDDHNYDGDQHQRAQSPAGRCLICPLALGHVARITFL
jgi:hypothetical protein